jgi:arabinofuranan 3-O-arabinosyltransferase
VTTAAPTATARPDGHARSGPDRRDGLALAILAAVAYVPLFLSHHGRLNADTKLYLYLDPARLLRSAPNLWNPRWSGGTVTHQNIGYLWPMGPYYRVADALGVPDWAAQRCWLASILFAAAAGAYWCFRSLWRDRWAAVAGGLVYGLSPFVLGHITGQSALLLPFAALPWLVWAVRNALRADSWRWAAVFALVTTTAGSLNGSSIFFVLTGAMLWIPYAVWWERSASLRRGLVVTAQLAGLTLATQLWWLAAYRVGGQYGLPILSVTETVRETSVSTSAIEVFRGLGYWFFYGRDHRGPWLAGFAPPFTQSLVLIAASFATPLLCLALGWGARVRERAYFATLVVVGLLMSTVAFGGTDRSLVGRAFESASRHSDLVLSLRNTQRAAALVAFGLAGLGAVGVAALRSRTGALGRAVAIGLIAVAIAAFVVPWRSALVPERYERPEDVPRAWIDTAAYLDDVGGRALVLPGIDFGAYRWGHTLDPVLAGLTGTELVWREQLPMGSRAGADLVGAFDGALQDGRLDPEAIVPVARALGITHIVVANDLEVERYRIARPESVMAAFLDPASGVTLERAFGPGYVNRAPGPPIVDDRIQREGGAAPLPQVAVFSVPGVTADPVTAYSAGAETVVHGDGAGVVAAAASGLLDDEHLPLLSGADLRTWRAARAAARGPGARHIVTDTSRREVRRYYTLRANSGATLATDDTPHSGLETDVPSQDFTGADRRAQSVAVLDGARSIDATGYGDLVRLLPEDRPANAFDGDARTAWRIDVPAFRTLRGDAPSELTIDLGRTVRADHVDVVQPTDRPGTQPIVRFEVVLDGERTFPAEVDPATALDPAGTRVELDGRPFSTLTVRIPDDPVYGGPIGIAEVAIPGVDVEEVVRLPRTLDRYGSTTGPLRVAYVLSRLRVDPGDRARTDPEIAMHRSFTVPRATELALTGTARTSGRAPDAVLDAAAGWSGPVRAASGGRLLGDAASRASAAVDGDLATAWRTPLDGAVGGSWTATVDGGFDLPRLTLDLVADSHHSVPTELALTVDGVTQTVTVPAVTRSSTPGATQRVVLTPDRPLVGTQLGIQVRAVDSPAAVDDGGTPVTLPVGIAEVDLGTTTPSGPAPVAPVCRDDLVTIDGAPVPLRLGVPSATDPRGTRAVTTCDGAPLVLDAGRHVLRTTPGLSTGVDLDRLALVSPGYTAAPTGHEAAAPRVVRADRNAAVVQGRGAPYWVRLDQSQNPGWEATARVSGRFIDLGPAHTLDAFASGWAMTGGTSDRAAFAFTWTPQRTVDRALALSGLAVLVCLALCVVRPRRRTADDRATPRVAADPFGGPAPRWYASVLVVVIGGAFGGPGVGAALALLAVGAALAPRWRPLAVAVRLAPLAALGGAIAFVLVRQARNDYPHVMGWPTFFRTAHVLAFFALLGVGLLVAADRAEDLATAPRPDPPPEDRP